MVAGCKAAAFHHFDAFGQPFTAQLELVGPSPAEVSQVVVSPNRQMPLRRPHAFKRNWQLALVVDHCPPLDQIECFPHAIVERHMQRIRGIAQMDFQFSASNVGALIGQPDIAHAIRENGLQAGLDIFGPRAGRVFLGYQVAWAVKWYPCSTREPAASLSSLQSTG